MIVLPNCTVATSRSQYSSVTGNSTVPIAHLSNVVGHISDVPTSDLIRSGYTLDADLKLTVDIGTDIVEGDVITAILKKDGTPFLGNTTNPNELLLVKKATNGSPMILPARYVYINRDILGGVAI